MDKYDEIDGDLAFKIIVGFCILLLAFGFLNEAGILPTIDVSPDIVERSSANSVPVQQQRRKKLTGQGCLNKAAMTNASCFGQVRDFVAKAHCKATYEASVSFCCKTFASEIARNPTCTLNR